MALSRSIFHFPPIEPASYFFQGLLCAKPCLFEACPAQILGNWDATLGVPEVEHFEFVEVSVQFQDELTGKTGAFMIHGLCWQVAISGFGIAVRLAIRDCWGGFFFNHPVSRG